MSHTHTLPPFASRAICGAVCGNHSPNPTCPRCRALLAAEAVPLPADIIAELARPVSSGQCLDGSTEACVPSMPLGVAVPRCAYCRRELHDR